jgi:hypothetical protein
MNINASGSQLDARRTYPGDHPDSFGSGLSDGGAAFASSAKIGEEIDFRFADRRRRAETDWVHRVATGSRTA